MHKSTSDNLDQDERALLEAYRRLSAEDRRYVQGLALRWMQKGAQTPSRDRCGGNED